MPKAVMDVIVLCDAPALAPLGWIHRAEARGIARELCALGHEVRLRVFRSYPAPEDFRARALLRLSDPVMREAVRTLSVRGLAWRGPSHAVLERCYDKYGAARLVRESGYDVPQTALASGPDDVALPWAVKPRHGSDSLGLKIVERAPLAPALRNDRYVVQQRVAGIELTIALFGRKIGAPLQILLPEGAPYTTARKYLWRPRRARLADVALDERVRTAAGAIGTLMEVNWAARIDFIFDRTSERLFFLECDAAPLVGADSAWATSFEAAGIGRVEQLEMLLKD